MSLRAQEIAEVVTEVGPLLRAERIHRVYQQDPYTLLFKTQAHVLLLSIHPMASRISLLTALPPRQPVGAFAQALRRQLESRRVLDLRQLNQDRAIVLVADVGPRSLQVVAELTGQHGNLFLLEDGVVRSSLLPNRSTRRNNTPGHIYVPLLPPPGERPHRSSRFRDDPRGPNAAIQAHYHRLLAEQHRRDQLARIARPLRRSLRHQRRLLERLQQDARRHRERCAGQRWGELILAQPHLVPPHVDRVLLPDLFADPGQDLPQVEIPMDPRRTAVQNASHYLARAAKGRRGVEALSRRIQTVTKEISQLEHALGALPTLSDPQIDALVASGSLGAPSSAPAAPSRGKRSRNGGARSSHRSRTERKAARQFLTSRGDRVLVGRGAEGNHHLTFRMARGRDIWLHTRDVPGAHVVLPMAGRSGAPNSESLLDAALLAKHYSDARDEAQCDVQWSRVKHLRHGARPGEVYVSQEKTLRVRHDAARIRSLLSSGSGLATPLDLPEELLPSSELQETP